MLEAAEIMNPKMWPAPTKTGAPYNFCFIKFSPNRMVEAAEARQTMFMAPLTLGVGVWGRIPATNLPPIQEYTHAKFHWDWSSGLDFYSGHTWQTHWLLYIRCSVILTIVEASFSRWRCFSTDVCSFYRYLWFFIIWRSRNWHWGHPYFCFYEKKNNVFFLFICKLKQAQIA